MHVTDHAVIRYAQRFHKIENINEEFIRIWINQNPDLYEKYKKIIEESFVKESTFLLVEAVFEKSKKNRNKYFVSYEDAIIFVTDISAKTIITLYHVDYKIKQEDSVKILKLFVDNIDHVIKEQQMFLLNKSEAFKNIDKQRELLSAEKLSLESRLRTIEIEEKELQLKSDNIRNTEREYETKVDYLYRKILQKKI